MNLASRCREAISHVAMLKKELAMHQRRAAEALALQRHNQILYSKSAPNSASKVGTESLPDLSPDLKAEIERMDILMGTPANPPPVPSNPPTRAFTTPAKIECREKGSPNGVFYSDFEEKSSESPLSSADSEDDEELGSSKEPSCPEPNSSIFKHKMDDYNEGFPDDLPQSDRKKILPFRPSAPEISEVDSENNSVSSNQSDYRRTIMSSIDAFEASFATSFPSSFSSAPKDDSVTPSEIYNPFFPSPKRELADVLIPSTSVVSVDSSAPLIPNSLNNENMSTNEKESRNTRSKIDEDERILESLPGTPPGAVKDMPPAADNCPQPLDDSKQPRTPISLLCRKIANAEIEEPSRPEKSASASARARYEMALQGRNYQSSLNTANRWSNKLEKENSEKVSAFTQDPSEKPADSNLKVETAETTQIIQKANSVLRRVQQLKESSPNVLKNITKTPSTPQHTVPTSLSKVVPTTSKPSTAFPRTQPVVASKTNEVEVLKARSLPQSSKLLLDKASSPSVSTAISVFEQAARKKEALGIVSESNFRRTNQRSVTTGSIPLRSASPGLPSDEEDELPIRSNARSASMRDFGFSKTSGMNDIELNREDGRNKVQGVSSRGIQSFPKRTLVYEATASNTLESYSNDFTPYHSSKNKELLFQNHKEQSAFSSHDKTQDSVTLESTNNGARNLIRNVSKPVSYAEPPLNSKLRQGAIFFPTEVTEKRPNNDKFRTEYDVRL
jgi:Shugoshin C terminus